ncbi:hypothetical protein BSPWISOXPB_4456 [uncultured Gammaproteobacteria bacterium]|nr:hypothetical protein BSPWISOXPB_4456 [uncultured Gammaproteobacteria bacterium]
MIKIILLTLLLSTSVHAGFFMDALESVRDAGVAGKWHCSRRVLWHWRCSSIQLRVKIFGT